MKVISIITMAALISYASAVALYDGAEPNYETPIYQKVEYLNAYKKDQINLQEFLDRKDEALIPFNENQPHNPLIGTRITDRKHKVFVNDRYDPYTELETVKVICTSGPCNKDHKY